MTVKARVPDLALAKLVGFRAGKERLGGVVTEVETVVNGEAPIVVLTSGGRDAAVDWEATLNGPGGLHGSCDECERRWEPTDGLPSARYDNFVLRAKAKRWSTSPAAA